MQRGAAVEQAESVAAIARATKDVAALIDLYEDIEGRMGSDRAAFMRHLGRIDLVYLMLCLMNRKDMAHPWLIDRVREVEASPNGHLDLWAREHYKSTIITFGKTVQDILAGHGDDPLPVWNGVEPTFGIFSHTRPTAKKFLRQIKQEFETNTRLMGLYPDILYEKPHKDAEKWSEEIGITVRRQTNPKEATVEAWGLIDGQPTGAHFFVRIYDDVVTRESVTTPEQIAKTTEGWELSINLGVAEGGYERYIGTRYAMMDTYHEMMKRGAVTPRIYPSTHDGTESGEPVFLSPPAHTKKRKSMGPTTFAAQMLQKPISKATATFEVDHLSFRDIRPKTLNIYIIGDPANSKRKGSDRTGIAVIGVDAQRNKYLLDGYNHKMNLKERWDALRGLRRHWMGQPGVQLVKVGYERYGMQSDLEHFETQMKIEGDAFDIHEVAWPKEGPGAKGDRIARLRPDFEQKRFYLPILAWDEANRLSYLKIVDGEIKVEAAKAETSAMRKAAGAGQKYLVIRPIKRKDEEGRFYDVTMRFIIEYLSHPAPGAFDDLIDAVSRIYDMEPVPPIIINEKDTEPPAYEH